jgi:hypothetical protein
LVRSPLFAAGSPKIADQKSAAAFVMLAKLSKLAKLANNLANLVAAAAAAALKACQVVQERQLFEAACKESFASSGLKVAPQSRAGNGRFHAGLLLCA